MEETKRKSKKQLLKEMQQMADDYDAKKKEIESLLEEGDKIEDKLKSSDRIFAIQSSINSLLEEMGQIEKEYEDKKNQIKENK